MKKLLAVLLATAMMMAIFAGCSGSSSSSPAAQPSGASDSELAKTGEELSGTLKLWTHQNEPWVPAYESDIAKFTALHPGVKIEMESFPYTDFRSKLQTSLVSGNGADIYVIFGSWASEYMPTGALSKVPDDLATLMDNDYYPSAKGGFTYDCAYYGFPLEYNTEYGGMLVNKKLMDERGLSYPTTWEELERIADTESVLSGGLMEIRGFDFVGYDQLTNLFLSLILSNGGEYLKDDGTAVDFTTPQAVEAMTKLVSYLKDRGWNTTEGLTDYYSGGYNALFKDMSLMCMGGPWTVSVGVENFGLEYGKDFDYIAMPQHSQNDLFAAETGWGYIVPENSPQKDLAWEFLRFMAEPENMMAHNIACSQLPPCKTVALSAEYAEAMPYTKPLLDILENGRYMGSINTDLLKQNINNMFIELVTTDTYDSVEDALKALTDNLNTLYAK